VVDACRAELGMPTTLVHCAARRAPRGIRELSFEEWQQAIAADLDAVYNVLRLTLPSMLAAGFGRLVMQVGSSFHTGLPIGSATVATVEASLCGLARALAHDMGSRGITANVLSTGPSEATREISSGLADDRPSSTDGILGRALRAEEIADVGLGLCERRAQIINGQTIMANGGIFAFGR
jgi:NAD(P)-dependent dehydrogenase (short-subunit alcohol dehydrogenase family)